MPTIKELTSLLSQVTDLADPFLQECLQDERKGVVKAAEKCKRDLLGIQRDEERLYQLLSYERNLYEQGIEFIAGVDEVGRGPLAGPVVAAAVILPKDCRLLGLDDSKKIPKAKHQTLYDAVLEQAVAVGIGIVSPDKIDEVNIYEATKLAMLEAIGQLNVTPQHLLIDAIALDCPYPQTSIIKGDANSLSIAAASIVAKVTRDKLMADYDKTYPGYDFVQNAGYGTKAHLLALEKLGICPIHRKTFEPIKSMLIR